MHGVQQTDTVLTVLRIDALGYCRFTSSLYALNELKKR